MPLPALSPGFWSANFIPENKAFLIGEPMNAPAMVKMENPRLTSVDTPAIDKPTIVKMEKNRMMKTCIKLLIKFFICNIVLNVKNGRCYPANKIYPLSISASLFVLVLVSLMYAFCDAVQLAVKTKLALLAAMVEALLDPPLPRIS